MNPCPYCHSSSVEMEGELAHCLNCEKYFKPYVPDTTIPSNVESQSDKIRNHAGRFVTASCFCLVLAALGFLAGLFATVNGYESARLDWIIFVGFFSAAIWLYLVAQLIHIRANTEK